MIKKYYFINFYLFIIAQSSVCLSSCFAFKEWIVQKVSRKISLISSNKKSSTYYDNAFLYDDENSEKAPFLSKKNHEIVDHANNYPKEKKKCNLRCCCLYKCLLFYFCPMMLITFSLVYLKQNNSVLKRGTPITNYLRSHGLFSHIEGIEQNIDSKVTDLLNKNPRPQLQWINDIGFKWYSDYIVHDICRNNKLTESLAQQISKFKERDLVYIDGGINKECFVNLFLPTVEKRNISISIMNRGYLSKKFFQAIEQSEAVLKFYTRAENYKHDDVTQKIRVVPLGMNYDVVFRTPLVAYFRYNFFGSLAQYTKEVNSLFDRLAKAHTQQSSPQIMKVFVDFFGNLIRRECYLAYTTNVDDISMSKRKCIRRSYAIFSIKEKIENYENLFFLSPHQVGQLALFEQRSKYAFLLSIPGDDLDCFRIWEALIFNNIVISKSHPAFNKFIRKHNHQLPIVIVDDYVNITKQNLARWYEKYAPFTSFNNKKTQAYLKLSFWERHFHS